MKRHLAQLLAVAVLCAVAPAFAKNVKFAGPHPRTGKPDGGFCYLEAVHVHAIAPANATLYRQHDGIFIFVGDPVPFGLEGPRFRFYGHHPITLSLVAPDFGDDVVFCYLDGPHWHPFEPPHDHKFVQKEDVHYFAGDYPPSYEKEKPRYHAANTVYRTYEYERPVVVEAPPPEYHGPVIDVRVHLPIPTVHVGVGVPHPHTVIVEEHHHHHKHKKFKHKKGHWK